MIKLRSLREIERMKVSCKITAEILTLISEKVKIGITTYELDLIAVNEAKKYKAKSAFKGYNNYPFSLCCSLNNQVVHGMPNKIPLCSGDIISLDYGILYDDYYGDAAITLPVGQVSDIANKLIKTTNEALYLGIQKAVPDGRLHDISSAIQAHAEINGFSVVRDFVGHGIGEKLHEDPQIPNYGISGTGIRLKAGMLLAIEPMINQKSCGVRVLDDGWTAITCDGGLSAHFEHTVAITSNGPEILTRI